MAGISRNASFVLGILLASLAAGCATSERSARVATYGAPNLSEESKYTAADRIFREGYIETLRSGEALTQPQIFAAYEGVDGARLAHRLYGEARAEQLDGACERFVKIGNGETLYDIAQYCDVPVSMLMERNPLIRNARHLDAGEIIEVPPVFNAERHLLAGGAVSGLQFASWYVVQPGDSLNDVAARHLVSAGAIKELNPGLDVEHLAGGMQLRIPASGAAPGAEPPVVAAALPYAYGPAAAYGGEGGYIPPTEVTGVMPYAASPAHAAADSAVPKSLSLAVDRKTVKPGGAVMVSAVGLPPNSAVSIYSGHNGADLDFVKTVVTDAEGAFSEPMTVKSSAGAGGIIFRATVDASGKQLQSPRVAVDKIKIEN